MPRVIADFTDRVTVSPASFYALGYIYSVPLDKWTITDMACDYVFLGDTIVDFEIPGTLGLIYKHKIWLTQKKKERVYPFIRSEHYLAGVETSPMLNFIYVISKDLSTAV